MLHSQTLTYTTGKIYQIASLSFAHDWDLCLI